jgi:hypothetical protein
MSILKKINWQPTINWSRVGTQALSFVHLQAFLTLICLPILILWGLPISILSPLGNIIFSPFLTLFLLLSSLIFFCEILYIPNSLFIWLLDMLTRVWTYILSFQHKYALVGLRIPPLWVLIAIPLLAFCILHYRATHAKKRAALLLTLLTFATCAGLKLYSRYHEPIIFIERTLKRPAKNLPEPEVGRAPSEQRELGSVILARAGREYLLIDPGYIGNSVSATSWVSYTLVPEIIKKTGTLTIDHLVVLQLNGATLEALITLCNKMTVKNLYIPWWTGILRGAAWQHYKKLSTQARFNNTNIIRLDTKDTTIIQADNFCVTAKPTGTRLNYKKITYPAYFIEGTIDNNAFTIYAAKHTKMKRIS